jgi:hypothetical protein
MCRGAQGQHSLTGVQNLTVQVGGAGNIAQGSAGHGEVAHGSQGVGVVVAQYPLAASRGLFFQRQGLPILASAPQIGPCRDE